MTTQDGTEEGDSEMHHESSLETLSVRPEIASTTGPSSAQDFSTSTPPSQESGSSSEPSPSQLDKGKMTEKSQLEESDQKLERSKVRKLLDNKLSNYKQNNLKKRLPASETAAEEFALRRKMMKYLENTDKAFLTQRKQIVPLLFADSKVCV